jgi:hypothetical protein
MSHPPREVKLGLPAEEKSRLRLFVRHLGYSISSMTVITATICRGCNAIVLAADRAVVASNPFDEISPLQFDSPTPKIQTFGGSLAVGIAGQVTQGLSIVRGVSDWTYHGFVSGLETGRRAVRDQFIRGREQSDEVARKWLDASRLLGMEDAAKRYIVKTSDWCVDFLVVAIDQDGLHLCTITENDPVPAGWDAFGFAAIGAGAGKAVASMSRRSVKIADDLPTAVYTAFEGKKEAAEQTPGVGSATDLIILRQDKEPVRWDIDGLEPLDAAYLAMRPQQLLAELRASIAALLGSKGITA